MKIPLVGGPYDGLSYDIVVDGYGKPKLDVLYKPRMTTIEEGLIECLSNDPMTSVALLCYRLVRVAEQELIDGCLRDSHTKWHWEYHYEA